MQRALLALLVAICLLCALTARAQLFSPGDLAKPHRKLEGDDNCTKCHSSGRRVEASLCTECHSDIGTQLKQGRGLHGREYAAKPCESCHIEHRGVGHELVRWPGGLRERFDHHVTGFELEGAHRKARCTECHTQRNERGAATFLAAEASCASCHEDPHQKRFGAKCSSCHNESTWSELTLDGFDHGLARFALHGKHTKVECKKCHGEPAQYRGLAFQACTSCHDDPHESRLGASCTACHGETSWSDLHMERSAHPGLSILGGHRNVDCATCHDRGLSVEPSKGSRCVSCHAPVHDAPFGRNCKACHSQIRWLGLPDSLGRSVHARTDFPLRGEHERVACDDCHDPKRPARERFRRLTFDRCTGCHGDVHRGKFETAGFDRCTTCHDEHGFSPSHFGVELHAKVGFPLEGLHVAVPCADCHHNKAPRVDFHIAKKACVDCHKNPHGEQFVEEMMDGGCANCHNPKGWHEPRIDHSSWPLTGAHELAPCRACHEPTAADKAAGHGASYRGLPRDCAGCHEDTHFGQFRLTSPVRGCAECHDTASFALPRFDHERMTGYALVGEHAALACTSCHLMEKLVGGEATTRWRLSYNRCADCHADPHGQGAP